MNQAIRASVDQFVKAQETARAIVALRQMLQAEPTLPNASYVNSCFRKMEPQLSLTPGRLALLRSFTAEPLLPFLQARAYLAGLDLKCWIGGFNTYAQELLDAHSQLDAFQPDWVILAVRTADVIPDLWSRFADLTAAECQVIVEETSRNFRTWIESFRKRSQASIIIQSLELPAYPSLGIADSALETGQVQAIRKINDGLIGLARDIPGLCLLDYDSLVARHGRLRWYDETKWLTTRTPIAADCWVHLAGEYMRILQPLSGKVVKALVVDLDNTLWGGVVGEDGPQGIAIGQEYPGAVYLGIQRVLRDLQKRGVLLAICSKNNEADALEVLQNHPGMLLRPQHFAARRINWQDKASNLLEIAAELNIGIDSLGFLDDNPAERELVRGRLPTVHVIDLPNDPLRFASTVRMDPAFERLLLSDEDQERTKLYADQGKRRELREQAGSLQDYYYSLHMKAFVERAGPKSLARIAQLTQKTNQFNLTTRRYTEQEIAHMMGDDGWRVLSLRLVDKLGDQGVVGVGILRLRGADCELDTFLLSCRVIGRTVESTFLRVLITEAVRAGATRMLGQYRPTAKNAPVRDFLPSQGFHLTGQEQELTQWELSLVEDHVPQTPWIDCVFGQEAA